MGKDKKDKKDKKKQGPPGKLVMLDDCVTPGRTITLIYKGPNPSGIAAKLTSSFQPFFRISSAGWGEDRFEWDTSGDPIGFHTKWWVKRNLSGFSSMRFDVWLQGDEGKQTKEGKFTLDITPVIETKFSENWFARGIFWIYNYIFYNRIRQDYIKLCREIAIAYREHLKGEMGLMTVENKQMSTHRM